MKERIKTILAFGIMGIVSIVSIILTVTDKGTDVYPNADTMICLYGETHGIEEYYRIELNLWKGYYAEGCRNLFVELPYYSAEFLNIWMQEDTDEVLDQFYAEIEGTQTGNEYFYDFLHAIKTECPETVFYGTDVGHQYDTTGARYLAYLEDRGLEDTENYELAKENIRQGEEYLATNSDTGITPVREGYMTSNFIDAYTRCGGGKIMGIYGSYHTRLENPEVMAGRLKSCYGDIISSVNLSTISFENGKKGPYKFGFCVTGLIFLLMLFIPNILWGMGRQPQGYEEAVQTENKILLIFERIGEVGTTVVLLLFMDFNPYVRWSAGGLFFEWRMLFWIMAMVAMILYECYWIRYFKSERTMADFYSSFAGFPLAGALLPVIAVFLLGIYAGNLLMIGIAIVLGIGHIGIHAMHKRQI